jgi:hypothetical protein
MENGTAAVHRAKGSIDRLSFSGDLGALEKKAHW